jgi:hypothetical protein
MNYIEQIRKFWVLHEIELFPSNAIALYFYLLEVNNKASWIESFKRNNSKICVDLGITYPTLNNSRNRLKQAGVIDFKTQNGSPNVVYTFKKFLKVTNEVGTEVSSEVGSEVGARSFDTKDKLNKKHKLNGSKSHSSPRPVKEKKIEFWEILVGCWFDFYKKKFEDKPSFNAATGKQLKSIITKIEKLTKDKGTDWTEDVAKRALEKFLERAWLDKWMQEHFMLKNLLSSFDAITNTKKDKANGTSETNTVGFAGNR